MIKDSGVRREFNTGAVRDISQGKGRCDLLPLDIISRILDDDVLDKINDYIRCGEIDSLEAAIWHFTGLHSEWKDIHTALLETSKQYEEGALKYEERNWEKGIPLHCFIDSAIRHYLKYKRGDIDEPHDRAVMWNLLGAMWTHQNKPEMIDLPFTQEQ